MTTATAAIANHLNIAEAIIAEVQEWANVLFVRFIGRRPRFVSKKVVEMQSVSYKNIDLKPITKAVMEVYKNKKLVGKADMTSFALTTLDIPAKEHGAILFDLKKIAGLKNTPKPSRPKAKTAYQPTLNPQWVMFNNIHNEGCEGYNPHPKYL